jgi:hypothetical protein
MNRLAVCLRGEVRNWNYTKEAVFKFYEGIAYSVDYYYATWDLPHLNQDELHATFDNRKLVQGVLCPAGNDRRRWGSLMGPAFLSSHIKLNKRYDAVIDTRFDLVPTYRVDSVVQPLGDMEIQTTNVNLRWDDPAFVEDPTAKATTDMWAIMTQGTWDQFNYRLSVLYDYWVEHSYWKRPTLNEIALSRTLEKMNIKGKECTWMANCLTRPCIVDLFPKSTDITHRDIYTIDKNTYDGWRGLNREQKREYCIKQNIYLEDYDIKK